MSRFNLGNLAIVLLVGSWNVSVFAQDIAIQTQPPKTTATTGDADTTETRLRSLLKEHEDSPLSAKTDREGLLKTIREFNAKLESQQPKVPVISTRDFTSASAAANPLATESQALPSAAVAEVKSKAETSPSDSGMVRPAAFAEQALPAGEVTLASLLRRVERLEAQNVMLAEALLKLAESNGKTTR